MSYKDRVQEWLESPQVSETLKQELRSIQDEKELEDRFYRELEFGTAGLRGVLGAGTNRMNIHTVGKATEGLARHLVKTKEFPTCAIAYDSRIKSDEFAMVAARILAAHGVKVFLYEELMPVPMLSYAVRYYKADAGVVVTASHNPQEYNGYKVYGSYGGQVTDEEADLILEEIRGVERLEDIRSLSEEEALTKGLLVYIGEEVIQSYMDIIKTQTVKKELVKDHASELTVLYTPIHGSGNKPVRRVLAELGYTNVHIVKEQELPDGTFPTAPYPNPENPQVFELALKLAETVKPDIIFGTDPDCDRVGVIVKDKEGSDQVLTGNQIGMLITNHILSGKKKMGTLPENGVIIKTIVSTESVRNITKAYGVELMDVLTGFKYIGEKIESFAAEGDKTFLFGFEESFGYLAGTHARDKDAIVASMLLCEIALYNKLKGQTLYDALIEIYETYGYFMEGIESFTLAGMDGQEKIGQCIEHFRDTLIEEIQGVKTVTKEDYKLQERVHLLGGEKEKILLPSSNVIKYTLEDDSWFVIRPSGTEPKMKLYMAIKGNSMVDAKEKLEKFKNALVHLVNEAL